MHRLLAIGAQLADEYEAAGKTGHPLLWARSRENILSTLDWMIDDDNAWRARTGRASGRQRAGIRRAR